MKLSNITKEKQRIEKIKQKIEIEEKQRMEIIKKEKELLELLSRYTESFKRYTRIRTAMAELLCYGIIDQLTCCPEEALGALQETGLQFRELFYLLPRKRAENFVESRLFNLITQELWTNSFAEGVE